MRLMRGVTAIAAIALVASGCTHKPPPPPPPRPAAIELPPLPRAKPEVHAHPNPPPTAPAPDIVLVGLSQAEIIAAIGEPISRTDQGSGQSWSYHGPHCSVDLTLFYDVSRSDFYALDRHIDGTDGSEKAAQKCLRQIRDSQNRAAAK